MTAMERRIKSDVETPAEQDMTKYYFNALQPGTQYTTETLRLESARAEVRHPRQDGTLAGLPSDAWQYLRVRRADGDASAGLHVAFNEPLAWGLVRFRVRRPAGEGELKARLRAGERLPRGLVWQADGLLRKWQDQPQGAWLLGAAPKTYKNISALWEFLYFDPSLAPRPPAPAEPSDYFSDLGHVFMRSDWGAKGVQVRFRCGPEVGKDDGDQNGFEIEAWGEKLTAAPRVPRSKGVLTQKHYDHLGWYGGTNGRNSLLIGGAPQMSAWGGNAPARNYAAEWLAEPGTPVNGQIQDIILASDYGYVAGEAREAYAPLEVETFLRQLLFAMPGKDAPAYMVIYDQLAMKEDKPTRFDWQLHSPFPFAIAGKAVTLTGNKTWLRGTLLLPEQAVFHMEKTPADDEPDKQDYLQVSPPAETGATEYLALLEIGKKDQLPTLKAEKIADAKQVGLKITGEGSDDLVLFSRAGRDGELAQDPWSAKARALFIRQAASQPTLLSLHGGTRIEGPLGLSADHPVNAVLERPDEGKIRLTVWNDQPVTLNLSAAPKPIKLDQPGRHSLTVNLQDR